MQTVRIPIIAPFSHLCPVSTLCPVTRCRYHWSPHWEHRAGGPRPDHGSQGAAITADMGWSNCRDCHGISGDPNAILDLENLKSIKSNFTKRTTLYVIWSKLSLSILSRYWSIIEVSSAAAAASHAVSHGDTRHPAAPLERVGSHHKCRYVDMCRYM